MSERLTWGRAHEARRERTGCPPWHGLSEAAVIVLCGVTVRTALPVALVVGTLLSVVNQGATIADSGLTPDVGMRVGFNYAVPFVVSSIGFLGAGRRRPDSATLSGDGTQSR
ncbi:nitrate/nitrite transporter NrtS [Janibacter sp. GS2]|uniref:nitrate/nitrite transporter NrtS n=1 Tax=Janibacter sp. GS2 TaxID=3442646 RepID=UPI003EC14A16